EIVRLAVRHGFKSNEINRFLSLGPDYEIAREALLKARSPKYFEYNNSAFKSYMTKVYYIFNLTKERPIDNLKPCLLIPGCRESLAWRCGCVYNNTYKTD
ncbi:hypothetical protein DER44DRAFT_668617, partial [Fusarium oxysporum]